MKSLEELVAENHYLHDAVQMRRLEFKERQKKREYWARIIWWSGFSIVLALIVIMFWLPVLACNC